MDKLPERDAVLARELEYYEDLYGGFAQQHFSKPAVVAFRRHLVARILRLTGAGPHSRVLSIGCGIGDTELLLARRVKHVVGYDLSPKAIEQARSDAARAGVSNAEFYAGPWEAPGAAQGPFDLAIAIFFLHHLRDEELAAFPEQLRRVLRPGALFYALDPSARRLSGMIGKLLVPNLMKKYETEDERPLLPAATAAHFMLAGFATTTTWYDFGSTPLAGLFPSRRAGYLLARAADDLLVRLPLIRSLSSNFELVARVPEAGAL